ncbi:hypothetical protein AB6A40_004944 [Gnathostoma spinigerum]|uniref:Uncharacterized protein n=1 Tax=Gnathostoma spinigerum TaxID=75299 RepID=A0ABD6EF61_9BILA
MSMPKQHFVPSPDVVTTIVLPTILFCVAMVVAMLIGINKCKQWELDKIVEMRRTRRVVQRITARLREKNFRTIQHARSVRMRKRAMSTGEGVARTTAPDACAAPPIYFSTVQSFHSGTSPPPSYEDAMLDEYFYECLPGGSAV